MDGIRLKLNYLALINASLFYLKLQIIHLDISSQAVVQYKYDAWGNHKVYNNAQKEDTDSHFIGNLNPFRYRSYYYDTETKLYYLKTRYYDPEVGRFINMDSIEYAAPQTINGLNLYAYCGNNPVMGYDPDGTWNWKGFGMAVAAVAIVGALAVASVLTAGTVAGVVVAGAMIGAGTGAIAGGVVSAVDAAANGEDVMEAFGKGMLKGSITGAISGAVAASPIGFAGQVAINAAITGGEYLVSTAIEGGTFNLVEFATNATVGAIGGTFGGSGLQCFGNSFGKEVFKNYFTAQLRFGAQEIFKNLGKAIIKSTVSGGGAVYYFQFLNRYEYLYIYFFKYMVLCFAGFMFNYLF